MRFLWVEADDSDAFSYPVSGNDYSGAVGAGFGYFLDDFVAFHLYVDGFLGGFFVFGHSNNRCSIVAILLISFLHSFIATMLLFVNKVENYYDAS